MSGKQTAAELAYLTRALKAPTLRDAVPRLAERARDEAWTFEEFLAACLEREVNARNTHGGEGRIRAARFPARKSLDEFDFTHAGSLNRDQVTHLAGLDFLTEKRNIVLLGPPAPAKPTWRPRSGSAPARPDTEPRSPQPPSGSTDSPRHTRSAPCKTSSANSPAPH